MRVFIICILLLIEYKYHFIDVRELVIPSFIQITLVIAMVVSGVWAGIQDYREAFGEAPKW